MNDVFVLLLLLRSFIHVSDFHTFQLGDWVFLASGTGLMPGPAGPIDICSELGGNKSVILPFRNPTDRDVVVDVMLKERTLSRSGKADTIRTRCAISIS